MTPTNAYRTVRNVDCVAGFAEKSSEKCSVQLSVRFGSIRFGFGYIFSNRPKLPDIFDKKQTKTTDRAIFMFGSQHWPLTVLPHPRFKLVLLW